ncbi:AraC family transcriptional regulator [Lactonifactor longoviformis]|uniref:AraC-type DNA-binding protein n=2 Tax=Lactonifactor TaxID=420345 RepID=A0A1M4YGJ8_9CLOT|nr:AraC family transcriptional regulator [Lactonifactor longoviformis]POP31515.1 AraC family transcriptional regulator [Lactonifactor longoviformis]SHF04642.1 AraC-type DNA-binding protein [Lactonifactor longoviformis DSM 17459]
MMEQTLAVQRMQDYIERHLEETITLADLAKVSMFSPWYSYRLFREYTNYTPADYIRRLKLSKSALRLRDEDAKVIDVAFDLGFQSAEGYQRAFFREFGCNPREYARHPVPLYLFIPYGVLYNEIRKENKKMAEVKNVYIHMVHKPVRKALIKRGKTATEYFTYCEEVGCDVWGLLTSIKSISGEPVCLWLPEKMRRPGTSEYVQGVEVPIDYHGEVPEGFDVVELPEAEYVMFQGEPFAEEDYCQAIEEVQEAIKKYQPAAAGYQWDTGNPRIQLEPIGTRGYIEMLPVKSSKQP